MNGFVPRVSHICHDLQGDDIPFLFERQFLVFCVRGGNFKKIILNAK